jgi:cell division protein FtsB
MWKESKKSFLSGFFSSPLFLSLVLLVLLSAVLFPLYKNMSNRRTVDKDIEDLRQEIVSMEAGNYDLKKLLTYLESDQFAETEARLNFGLKKKGEEIVIIKEEESFSDKFLSEDELGGQSSNPLKWMKYFFGKQD